VGHRERGHERRVWGSSWIKKNGGGGKKEGERQSQVNRPHRSAQRVSNERKRAKKRREACQNRYCDPGKANLDDEMIASLNLKGMDHVPREERGLKKKWVVENSAR